MEEYVNGLIDNTFKNHDFEKAVLKAGTTVTVLDKKVVNESEYWLKIPSGWIAGYYGGKYYVR